jgi:hypothetical protein
MNKTRSSTPPLIREFPPFRPRRFSSLAAGGLALILAGAVQAYQGMPVPQLHVSGASLQDPSGKNVLLHGWMQPADSWFNGEGHNFTNPTDYTNSSNYGPALNFYKGAVDIFSTTSGQYGYNHGWDASFVRFIGDGNGVSNFAPGWDASGNLANATQFNAWINNVLVPYCNYCATKGLYVVICGNPSVAYPGGNAARNMTQQYQNNLKTFWQALANNAGLKNAANVMFEICNEPIQIETSFGANNWGSGNSSYWSALTSFMQPIVTAIRNTGANNIIWIPGLGYQGEYQGFATYPVTGTNIGYAGHFYPAYGNVHDNATAVQNLWNSNYKPAANIAPFIITECYWYPNDGVGYKDLFNGHTSGFGNAAKAAFDGQGNVSYLVGMIGDLLANINSGLASTTLNSQDGAQASFAWWVTYQWAAPTSGGGGGGGSIANGTYKLVSRASGLAMEVMYAATANGSQVDQYNYFAGNHQKWAVTLVSGSNYKIIGVASGRGLDINGASSANGTKVQLYDYWGASSQLYTFTPTSGGYYRLTPNCATGSAVEVAGGSTSPGALVQLYSWNSSTAQQWSFQAP